MGPAPAMRTDWGNVSTLQTSRADAPQWPDARTRGDNDVAGLQLFVAIGAARDGHAVRGKQTAVAAHDVDLVLAHEVPDALDLPINDAEAALDGHAVVGGDVVGRDAEIP